MAKGAKTSVVLSFPQDDSQLRFWVEGRTASDEGGIHGAGVLCAASSRLEKLLY